MACCRSDRGGVPARLGPPLPRPVAGRGSQEAERAFEQGRGAVTIARGQIASVALGADGVGGGFGGIDGWPLMRWGRQFVVRGALGQQRHSAEQGAGERHASQRGPDFELTAQRVRYVAKPDHSRHSKWRRPTARAPDNACP